MEAMNISQFRRNMSASLDRVDRGEHVIIRRHDRQYRIVPEDDEPMVLTPELKALGDLALQHSKEGKTLTPKPGQSWDDFFASI